MPSRKRFIRRSCVFTALFAASSVASIAATEPPGAVVYKAQCAACHDAGAASRVPPRSTLAQLPASAIVKALESGVMKIQGSALTAPERLDVANWLSDVRSAPQTEAARSNHCSAAESSVDPRPGWTSWGAGLENQRYQANSGLTAQSIPRLKLKWAFGDANGKVMRSQPVVYHGRVYLGTESGSVTALDSKTGCAYWSVKFKNVRSGLVIGKAGETDALFFGDVAGVAHALDLATGKELWQSKVSDHITALATGTPAYFDGRLYVPLSSYEEVAVLNPQYHCCTFRGSVSSLDAATGALIWRGQTIQEQPGPTGKTKSGAEVSGPSGAGIWSTPTLDPAHHALYVTTGDNYSDPATSTSDALLAFDLETGRQLWSRQFTVSDVYNLGCGKPGVGACKNANGPDYDFGASPILAMLPSGKRCLLLGQKSGMVYAADPDDRGKVLWQARAGVGGPLGGVQWGPATDGNLLFVAVSDIAFKANENPGQFSIDPGAGGGLSAFSISTGKLAWKADPPVCGDRRPCSPAQSAAVTAIAGAVFSGSLDGHIRAYSGNDGAVLWDFDTERSFDTVNHVPAEGGSLDVSGAIVSGGMVFITSGYPQYGGKAGNVLLAFGLE